MKIPGAQIIIETLIEQGCDTVFGYPGGSVLNIYDELYKNSDRIRHVLTAHEQGASHAADGYARATGKVGVVIATSGPGATNLVTGLATAYLDSVPMVAITGNVSVDLLGRDSFQEVDIMGVTLPVTKHNYIVKKTEDLADTIREAFKIAKSGRPGPVLIDIPKNVQIDSAEYEKGEMVAPYPKLLAADDELSLAVQMLEKAERPFIYMGGGIYRTDAGQQIIALSEKIDAPVASSMMGLSAIPYDYPRFLGMQGMHGDYAASKAMDEADLILAAGVRFSDRATGNKAKFSPNAKIIHIDTDTAELSKNINAHLGIVGDIRDALERITAAVAPQTHREWNEACAALRKVAQTSYKNYGDISPYEIIREVNRRYPRDAVIATDVGQHQMWVAQTYQFSVPHTFLTSGGLGTMGYGLGAAIGGAVGAGRKTVLFTGDGSFGMNLNELTTAVSQSLPLTIIIMNNGVLGMVRQWQTLFYEKHYSNTTLNRATDFVKLAEAFGAKGYRAETIEQFRAIMDAVENDNGVNLIDCRIDEDEMVLPMMPPGGTVEQIILSRKEIES